MPPFCGVELTLPSPLAVDLRCRLNVQCKCVNFFYQIFTVSVRKSPLTRELILGAALRLVDAGGVELLSMRRLAAELGVKAMSLYNHVASLEALRGEQAASRRLAE